MPLGGLRGAMARCCAVLRAAVRRLAVAVALVAVAPAATAQQLDRYFNQGVAGYGAVPGVTVLSRLRPEYEPAGVHVGGVIVNADVAGAIGYDSNATGETRARPSVLVRTDANFLARSNWGRHGAQVAVSVNDRQYLGESRQSTTGWNAALGGFVDIGRHQATFAYSHVAAAQTPRDLGAPQLSAPAPYTIDSAQAAFTWNGARVAVTPSVEYAQWRYANATQGGVPLALDYQDRDVLTANLLARLQASEGRSVLVVLRGIDSRYRVASPGQPGRSSTGVEALVGVEYAAGGVWRYRLLGGWQARQYADRSVAGPTVEASAIWQPTGLTTVTASALHTLAESALATTLNYTLSQGRVTVDHELRRNLLLQARAEIGQAAYSGNAGTATLIGAGASLTWLVNRRVRMTLSQDYVERQPAASGFAEHITLLRLGFAL